MNNRFKIIITTSILALALSNANAQDDNNPINTVVPFLNKIGRAHV